ncbi:MAG: hypothetical protein WCG98_07955 [bacterium]
MGKKKNEALAKSLTTALTELHDKIIPTYIAKPDKVDANWIAVLNLYLVLIKGQNIKVDKEQSPTLLSHLDTEKANRVLKHTENKTEDYTKNLKDFGLKTLKKFPTLSGC